MNEKKFSDVMKEDDTDYIDETISNSHKAKQNSRFNRRLVIVSTAVILVTKTSHTLNGLRTLKIQYFS